MAVMVSLGSVGGNEPSALRAFDAFWVDGLCGSGFSVGSACQWVTERSPMLRGAFARQRPWSSCWHSRPGTGCTATRSLDVLWPDSNPEAGANQLRKPLHEARRTLDPDPA